MNHVDDQSATLLDNEKAISIQVYQDCEQVCTTCHDSSFHLKCFLQNGPSLMSYLSAHGMLDL